MKHVMNPAQSLYITEIPACRKPFAVMQKPSEAALPKLVVIEDGSVSKEHRSEPLVLKQTTETAGH